MDRRSFALSLVSLALVVSGCGKPKTAPPTMQSSLLGQPIPKFRRPTLAGATFDTEGAKGKVVVVKFFAEYCAPCKVTLPEAESLSRKHDDVAFVGISEDEYESKTREVIGQYGLTFPVVHDGGQVLAGRFRVAELPMTFVIDAAGTVRWVGGPGQHKGDLEAAIASVRAGS